MRVQDWFRLPFRLLLVFGVGFFLAQDFRRLNPVIHGVKILGTPQHPIIIPAGGSQ
jgi:hypothetical protein